MNDIIPLQSGIVKQRAAAARAAVPRARNRRVRFSKTEENRRYSMV
jgi:hypothetical protein